MDIKVNTTSKKASAVELINIYKAFGSVVANNNVNLSVKQGEILALLGENGSGKTTLMNILSGIYKPDKGQIFVNGEDVTINSPEDSSRLGIGMIHQHFKLVEVMSAGDNIFLGGKNENFFIKSKRYDKIKKISKEFGLDIDPSKPIYDMSVSEKQTVEIIKVLYLGARTLILDEPTAVLTPQETAKLFEILKNMKKAGCAIIIITHKLNEVMEISDRVSILRKGESVGTLNTNETNEKQLTECMVGHPVELSIERPICKFDEKILFIHHLTVEGDDGVNALKDASFEMKRGEILGVAGVAGSGQKELCEAIAGLRKVKLGAILYKKENIEGKSPRDIIKMGISMSFIPEDRLGMGLAASLSMTDNVILKSFRNAKGPFVNRFAGRNLAKKMIQEFDIVTPGPETPVRRLSGGNVQKVLLGREIAASPNVIITAYPVRGLDINSSYMIYEALNKQKEKGVALLFIGEDLDVMIQLCDKIMVLCHGEITGIVKASETSKEELGLLMTGSVKEETNE